jgi:peptidoglycan/xylan/chitin deacetylase (PgdA/CDA1 family)
MLGEVGEVGVARIPRLLAGRRIRATYFVTGHTAETCPESLRAIVANGEPRTPFATDSRVQY